MIFPRGYSWLHNGCEVHVAFAFVWFPQYVNDARKIEACPPPSGSRNGMSRLWRRPFPAASTHPTMGAPPLPDALRQLIIQWRYNDHKIIGEIATLAHCHISTVHRVLARFENTGSPYGLPRGHRARILTEDDLKFLLAVVRAQPKSYLDELQTRLWQSRGVAVSLATLSRTLYRLGYSRKSVSREAAQRDEFLRAIWRSEYADLPFWCFVWLDESGLDDRGHVRTDGWAPVGFAPICSEPFVHGLRLTMLPAFSADGIIAMDILDGGVTKERFIAFVRDHLVRFSQLRLFALLICFAEAEAMSLATR
jgi:transposase